MLACAIACFSIAVAGSALGGCAGSGIASTVGAGGGAAALGGGTEMGGADTDPTACVTVAGGGAGGATGGVVGGAGCTAADCWLLTAWVTDAGAVTGASCTYFKMTSNGQQDIIFMR